jgi:aerotaxis receptor
MSVQIAAAVEEQSAMGDHIQSSLDGIRMATDSNVAASTQSRTASDHVAGLAKHLQLLSEQFWGRQHRN